MNTVKNNRKPPLTALAFSKWLVTSSGVMTYNDSISERRAAALRRLFPGSVPGLWCPLLTHYNTEGALDASRIAAHLRHLAFHVKGFLIPGSTGDGWELSDAEFRQLIEVALDQVEDLNLNLLIGILKPDASTAATAINEITGFIKSRTGRTDPAVALGEARVCGFTVCPPRGSEVSQPEIERALTSILEAGLPTAVYQLPQVTQNEISPEVASNLATRFENFLMFKDSSGTDRVALSGKGLAGVFTVRGAEGDYAQWLRPAGGPYNGFLLSTANCFARELGQLIEDISARGFDAAKKMSERLSMVIGEAFRLVNPLPDGNPYANANKAMDHFFAYGPQAASVPPPRLHAGSHLPVEMIRATGEILSRYDLMPDQGYL